MWFRQRETLQSLQQQLADLETSLAAHPWNSAQAIEAREVTERYKPEGTERVEAELVKRGLPSLVALSLEGSGPMVFFNAESIGFNARLNAIDLKNISIKKSQLNGGDMHPFKLWWWDSGT